MFELALVLVAKIQNFFEKTLELNGNCSLLQKFVDIFLRHILIL